MANILQVREAPPTYEAAMGIEVKFIGSDATLKDIAEDQAPFLAVAKRFSSVSELASDGAIRLVVPNRAWVRVSHQPFRAMITHARPDTQNFKRDGPEASQNEKTGRPE